VVLASFVFGPGLWPQWLQSLPRFEALIGHSYLKVGPGDLAPGLWWRVALDLAGVAFAWRRRDLVGLLAGDLLCAPYVQLYDLAGLSFLGAILVRDARRERPVVVVFAAFLILCVAAPVLTTIYCAGLAAIAEWRARTRRPRAAG